MWQYHDHEFSYQYDRSRLISVNTGKLVDKCQNHQRSGKKDELAWLLMSGVLFS